ncbi:MAG TPA: glycosyltransferase family 4 protein, partial [Terriglobales bacterium]|nr:glycosyltransferase family 4 protein [Terriglobales bacterium]
WVWWGGTPRTESTIGGMKKAVRSMIAKLADRWISYGGTSTEYLMSLGIPRHAITQIQNCVDERMFPPRAATITTAEPVLLCAGHLIRRKGVDRLLHAAAALRREGFKFHLLLVGEGAESGQMQQLARTLQLDNVIFEPAKSPQEMSAVYRRSDCLVFPTLADVWGLVVNEAVLSGIPVLCSRYAGCAAELVAPENIFDPCNPEEFRSALRRAVIREVKPCDASRLLTSKQVADLVLADLMPIAGTHGSLNIRYSESA